MKNKIIFLMASCLLFGGLVVLTLWYTARQPGDIKNGFNRTYRSNYLTILGKKEVGDKNYYIAGITKRNVYLVKFPSRQHVLMANLDLQNSMELKLKVPRSYIPKLPQVVIDSPYFHIMDSAIPVVLNGSFETHVAHFENKRSNTQLVNMTPISDKSYAGLTYERNVGQYVLAKHSAGQSDLTYADNILKKQLDGLFCTDGMLHYNLRSSKLLFLYYYRNEFIYMDTNFHVLYKGRTIDTTSHAKLAISEIDFKQGKDMKLKTLSAPPQVVNNKSCTTDSLLFVNSNLQADNESFENFQNNLVFDVYSLDTGTYQYSFYLSNPDKEKLNGFKVTGNVLVAVIGQSVESYTMKADN